MAIVYVLSNPAFDRYVKVGRTIDLEQRLRQLDNTSVPLPFRCEFAISVDDEVEAERLVHQAFADVRVRSSREFFEVEAQRVIAALKLTGGRDVTPKEDVAEDAEGVEALERTVGKRKSYSFDDAHVSVGDVLVYTRDESITATIVADKKIQFEEEVTSLSRAALTLLHRDGYKWKQANGWAYWMKDGETMGERVERFAPVEEDD
jgi:hypothetical protein